MIAVDTNRLVYAHRRESRHHEAASSLLRELVQGDDAWAIPWPCCYEFLNVVTNPRIWRDNATSPEQSWRQLAAWTASPSLRLIGETEDFPEVLERFVRRPRVIAGVVHDARIAAMPGPWSRSATDPGPRRLAIPGTQDAGPNRRVNPR